MPKRRHVSHRSPAEIEASERGQSDERDQVRQCYFAAEIEAVDESPP